MRIFLGLAFLLITFAAQAQIVSGPYISFCGLSYRSDSYGHGIEAAFTGENMRSSYNDESCYNLGIEAAKAAIALEGFANCNSKFENAYREGFTASSRSAGVQCYNLGYSAGLAALNTGAREGITGLVGKRCVNAYKAGRADGKAGRAQGPGTTEQPELSCYLLGHFEFPLFN